MFTCIFKIVADQGSAHISLIIMTSSSVALRRDLHSLDQLCRNIAITVLTILQYSCIAMLPLRIHKTHCAGNIIVICCHGVSYKNTYSVSLVSQNLQLGFHLTMLIKSHLSIVLHMFSMSPDYGFLPKKVFSCYQKFRFIVYDL